MKKVELLNFTTLYRFGKPFETEATVIEKNLLVFNKTSTIEFFEINVLSDKTILTFKLEDKDRVYGLGQTLGGLNKRGKRYKLYATDDPLHTPEKESLYGSHPFLIVSEKFGFFIDYPSEIIFDIGYTKFSKMIITVHSKDFDLYIFNSKNNLEIIQEYLKLTGTPYIPPKWAFGYQQCRWSYPDAKTIKEISENFRKKEIPCDAIYMDIDYMKDYKVFTVDEDKFPDFKTFVSEIHANGFHLIPILDPGVKIEKGYEIYDEGVKNNYFCKDKKGENFVATVWPGYTHFPDFLNPEVRKWWGEKYKRFFEMGITGFWNDMNEPSIFFVPDNLNEYFEKIEKLKEKEIGLEFFMIKDEAVNLSNKREYYESFYHETPYGKYTNDELHNLYGYYMTKATVEDGFNKYISNKRYLLLSRSSYSGHHRIATIWMGDNMSWWEHMIVNIQMLMSLNMAGFFYTGADIGGFGANASPELIIRWMQLGVFSPLYRNHSAIGTRQQEPWAFDNYIEEIMKNTIKLRYALIPYLYSEFFSSVEKLKPFISPIFFHFDDETSKNIEDQFMVGDSIMAAPIIKPNARGRFVHLPEVKWLYWKASKVEDREIKVYDSGDYFVESNLNEIPIFIKENTLIALNEENINYVNEKNIKELTIIGLVTDKAEFEYFEDDGDTYNYKDGKYTKIKIKVVKNNNDYEFEIKKDENEDFISSIEKIKFEIYDEKGSKINKIIEL
ncbi:alpha-glucosidase [Marinitoga hydrogenitolerans DSM 16785]|uniref:Alpha-glucosidase n=1 Tax=Marinitoga hydrogenitolerans (strain DSM 16785 / JCM 12826 / AT1271) TaxID=1122195 RepID=A0A1M4S5D0_MARH1|nr:TIM-barrel domain-containing protein [Marinitoga hydrogenitolerans]SHE27217.1 alpha-glucosidase [Marinitoga hydrogenitolerans DSM 16785]